MHDCRLTGIRKDQRAHGQAKARRGCSDELAPPAASLARTRGDGVQRQRNVRPGKRARRSNGAARDRSWPALALTETQHLRSTIVCAISRVVTRRTDSAKVARRKERQ